MNSKLRDTIVQAFGEASVACWEFPERAGVFDPEAAMRIIRTLIEEIDNEYSPETWFKVDEAP